MDKAVERTTKGCHTCASLLNVPHTMIEQSTGLPPESLGIMFAADVIKRERQLILVVREYVSSYTVTRLISSERSEELRDSILSSCIELCPLDGPHAVIRTDCAPGFKALCDDPLLQKHRISIELGRTKNKNKNPVGEKAVREIEDELLRQDSRGGPVSARDLALATARLNSRIRSRGLSSREMWYQRDQFTNSQIPLADQDIIMQQHQQRVKNHKHSELAKAPSGRPPTECQVEVGNIVYLYSDRDKHRGRDRYLVVAVEGQWCHIKRFSGAQLRNTAYRVKRSECYKVPSNLCETRSEVLHHGASDTSDEEAEESNNSTQGVYSPPFQDSNPPPAGIAHPMSTAYEPMEPASITTETRPEAPSNIIEPPKPPAIPAELSTPLDVDSQIISKDNDNHEVLPVCEIEEYEPKANDTHSNTSDRRPVKSAVYINSGIRKTTRRSSHQPRPPQLHGDYITK